MYNIRIVMHLKHEYLKYKMKKLVLKANNINKLCNTYTFERVCKNYHSLINLNIDI